MEPVLPIYYQIKHTIRSWIVNKEFDPGQKIPSVNDLAEEFDVNRLTVRQAISHLIQEGFLNSKRGEGTFVTNDENLINSFDFEFSGFVDDLIYRIPEMKIKSVEMGRIIASKYVRQKLELRKREEGVIQIKRVRSIKDRLLTYTTNYLPEEIGAKIGVDELYRKRLLQILGQDFGIQFTEAVQTIGASFASQEVAEKIGIPSGTPVLFVERTMYTKWRKPVELFQCVYPGDLYKFIVRFRNVRRKDGREWIQDLKSQMKPGAGRE